MSRYVMTEQRASFTVPERHTEPPPKRRTPLPDTGEPGTSRLPSSARRYPQPVTTTPMRVMVHDLRTHRPAPNREAPKPQRIQEPKQPARQERLATTHKKPMRALTLVGSGMLLMIVLYFLCSSIGAWWQGKQDDWTYGNPRTYHTDHRVGHSDETIKSHFIAMNLDRQVRIIEFPGNDPSKAKVYIGPTLQGNDQEQAPVTLKFADVNQDNKPDMLILVRSVVVSVFINDVIKDIPQFRPAKPEEVIHV